MNDNLTQLVKESPVDEVMFSESDLDLPDLSAKEEDVSNQDQEASEDESCFYPITSLSKWFETNCQNFTNINQVKVSIRGVDPDKTLIVTVKDSSNELDSNGNEKRSLKVFENADLMPVLDDLQAIGMDVYNNGFKVIYQVDPTIFIKAYGIKTGLICVFCHNIGDKLIPYEITRIKKKDSELKLIKHDPDGYIQALSLPANLETLQLLYKQSSKAVESFQTNQDIIDWLIDRQKDIMDINHHLQIDNVIMSILS